MRMSPNSIASAILALLAFVLAAALVHPAAGAPFALWRLRASFINVNQGDAALLQDPGGCNVLIDGGSPSKTSIVLAYLRTQGVHQLDAVIATHADSDHFGGLTGVIQAADISVTQVLYNGYGDTASTTWNAFVAAVVTRGLTLTVAGYPTTYTWCSMTAQVLNPDPHLAYSNDNDASIVLLAQNGPARMLFTGDIPSTVEPGVISRASAGQLPVDVLKVSHHGSKSATSSAFLAAVKPLRAVISVGPNAYGHPATETLQRLGSVGAIVYRTDLSGTIVLESSTYTYRVFLPMVQ